MLTVDFMHCAGLPQSSVLLGALWEQHYSSQERWPKSVSESVFHCSLSFFFLFLTDCTGILDIKTGGLFKLLFFDTYDICCYELTTRKSATSLQKIIN